MPNAKRFCQKFPYSIRRMFFAFAFLLVFAGTNVFAQISFPGQAAGAPALSKNSPAMAPVRAGSRPVASSQTAHVPPGLAKLHHPQTSVGHAVTPPSGLASIFQLTPTYLSGGLDAYSSAVGDVNGDGIADVLVVNQCASNSSCTGSVGVLLGNGDGTFQAAVSYAAGADAVSIAAADVNGDGHLDILVANQCSATNNCNSGSVSVLLGNGDGTFQAAVSYDASGTSTYSIAVSDVNGDGKPDVVMTNICTANNNCNSGSVSVLLGNGDGTFQTAVPYNSGGADAYAVAIADLNGDGHPDLVVANNCASSNSCTNGAVAVLLGNGDGTFQAAVAYGSGGNTARSVAVGDLNGDGHPDLVVANQCGASNNCWSGTVGVLLGNGDGTFQAVATYASGGQTLMSVATADVSGDGKLDVIVADQCDFSADCGTGLIGILVGNGDGTLQTVQNYTAGARATESVVVKDLNGDGKLDLVATSVCNDQSCSGGAVSVLLANGNGTFQGARSTSPGGVSTFSLVAADLNGDGKADLVVANQCDISTNCNGGTVGILLGNGDGTFLTPITYGSGGSDPLYLTAGDVNGDGKVDVLVANQCSNQNSCTGSVGVLLGNGDGTFQPAVAYSSAALYAVGIAVGDVNGDGKADLVVVNECDSNNTCDNGTVSVLLGNGDGTFQPAVNYNSGGSSALAVAVGDVNGDGKLDVLVTNQCASNNNCNNGAVSILLGNGDGTFQPAVSYGTGATYASSLLVGDVNRDGKLDLMVANECLSTSSCNDGSISTLLGNGDGTFQAPFNVTVPSPQTLSSLSLADFNGDGYLDVVSGGGEFLLLGNGDGTFQPYLALAGGGYGTAVADFNGDGKPDLASGGITIFINQASSFHFPTTTAVAASANPANGFVNFTATISPAVNGGAVSGDVTFYDGATQLGSATVTNNAQAVLSNVGLTLGVHSITAVYAGSSSYLPSTSAALMETENQWATTTMLSSSQNPSVFNQSVAFTTTVTPLGGTAATGTVVFMDGTTTLGTVSLTNGSASYTTSTLAAGMHSITAVYGGASIDSGSTSSAVSQVVSGGATATALTGSSTSAMLTLTATVRPVSAGTPTGTVAFMDGTTSLGSSALTGSGSATFSTSALSAGTHNIMAIYSGDAAFTASTSSAFVVLSSFNLSASTPSPSSVTAGQSSTSTINVSPMNGFDPSGVTFTCSVTPAVSPAASCSVATVTVANDAGTATLTVTTVAGTSARASHPAGPGSRAMILFALLIPGLLIGTGVKQRGKLLTWTLTLVVLGGCLLQSACGGGSPKTAATANSGTPVGSYTATITGSANDQRHTTTASITVK